jgi:hypothetical protein
MPIRGAFHGEIRVTDFGRFSGVLGAWLSRVLASVVAIVMAAGKGIGRSEVRAVSVSRPRMLPRVRQRWPALRPSEKPLILDRGGTPSAGEFVRAVSAPQMAGRSLH